MAHGKNAQRPRYAKMDRGKLTKKLTRRKERRTARKAVRDG